MLKSKNARRIAAALAVPLLLFTAACGADDDSSAGVVKVDGKFGEKPKISVPKDAKASDKVIIKTVVDGKGDKVAKGDYVRLDIAAQSMKGGQDLGSTWTQQPGADAKAPRTQIVAKLGEPNQMLPTKVIDAVAGHKDQSRFKVEGTAKAIIGDQLNPQSGIKPGDGLVWVIDVAGVKKGIGPKAYVKGEQAATAKGMPAVKAEPLKAATVTVPKGQQPPKDLQQQVLIQGKGPEVKAGQGVIVQYTGVKWEDGKKFDSSWDHGGAIAFQIGTGSVVKGWDDGLVGKHVGDRLALVIPPKLGYGGQPQHELAKNTLVFVVDIVGAV